MGSKSHRVTKVAESKSHKVEPAAQSARMRVVAPRRESQTHVANQFERKGTKALTARRLYGVAVLVVTLRPLRDRQWRYTPVVVVREDQKYWRTDSLRTLAC